LNCWSPETLGVIIGLGLVGRMVTGMDYDK
jgi:hypothetical protein